ncbi:hypothetical protein IJG27_02675 [Candidatus Saccharibacteria bacterium]|nr:hypothetical protein [Candidatus Saccharibacteria bacterium]MBQ7040602.1 hypothetical protein [Candidatus Saccharibacteria bacterium]
MKKQRSGFTLLETALVVAIATLLFMAIVVGFGSRIATGRYDTAATEIVDYLRDVYTEALNTENYREGIEGAREYCTLSSAFYTPGEDASSLEKLFINESGQSYIDTFENNKTAFYPGRTNCAIYGKIAFFGVKGDSEPRIHVFDIVGNVVTGARQIKQGQPDATTDLEILQNQEETYSGKKILDELEYVHADFRAAIPDDPQDNADCRVSPAAGYTTYNFDWNTFPSSANHDGKNFVGFAMIVRSPLSGNVSTLFYESPSDTLWDFGLGDGPISCSTISSANASLVKNVSPVEILKNNEEDSYELEDEHTGFCLNSSDFYTSLVSRRKYIEFIGGGQNATAIKLEESDKKESNPCI